MDYRIYRISELREQSLPTCLSEEEQALATRRGKDFAICRSLLKQEIARRLHLQPQDMKLLSGTHGKPEFPGIHFNISHSGDCLCMAFHHRAIGVDVERIKPRDFARLARHFMPGEQWKRFVQRNCPQHEFYACWCAAEALVKMVGDTIWNASAYPFVYEDGRIIVAGDSAPTVELFTPMPGYMGALAYLPQLGD